MLLKRSVIVSDEFTSFVGHGSCDRGHVPLDPVILSFGDIGEPCVRVSTLQDVATGLQDDMVVLAIARDAWRRLLGDEPRPGGSWYLSADLRALGRAILSVDGDTERDALLRSARSVELACAVASSFYDARMVEVPQSTRWSERDIALVAAAHQFVSEHFEEKLTVSQIARRCGLNRLKLSSGFQELYKCTVADAVADRRLEKARQLLAQSELPVATIGYRCGYMSASSFTRAFTRRYGATPTQYQRDEQNCSGRIEGCVNIERTAPVPFD